MNYIDIYLQRNNLRKFDVVENLILAFCLFSNYKINRRLNKFIK